MLNIRSICIGLTVEMISNELKYVRRHKRTAANSIQHHFSLLHMKMEFGEFSMDRNLTLHLIFHPLHFCRVPFIARQAQTFEFSRLNSIISALAYIVRHLNLRKIQPQQIACEAMQS